MKFETTGKLNYAEGYVGNPDMMFAVIGEFEIHFGTGGLDVQPLLPLLRKDETDGFFLPVRDVTLQVEGHGENGCLVADSVREVEPRALVPLNSGRAR